MTNDIKSTIGLLGQRPDKLNTPAYSSNCVQLANNESQVIEPTTEQQNNGLGHRMLQQVMAAKEQPSLQQQQTYVQQLRRDVDSGNYKVNISSLSLAMLEILGEG